MSKQQTVEKVGKGMDVKATIKTAEAELATKQEELKELREKLREKKRVFRQNKRLVEKADVKKETIQQKIAKVKDQAAVKLERINAAIEKAKKDLEKVERENGKIMPKAKEVQKEIEKLNDALLEARAEANQRLGTGAGSSTAALKRARTNFIKFLAKENGDWVVRYDSKENPIGAVSQNGNIQITFGSDTWQSLVNGEETEHKYGHGAMATAREMVAE